MIHIRNLQDLSIIQDDPELYREVASYILYCRFEMLEDEEDIDDHDFSISVFQESDLDYIDDLGPPEETAVTQIECCSDVRVFHRLVFPTEIIFYKKSPQ
ncbi:MAG: hypothetical protein DRO01_07610 [Thermoproteota archaeon]|nr:MAG: hypothetical protein DRO01_07610 [Candidatus Korarchaeota archaeon]